MLFCGGTFLRVLDVDPGSRFMGFGIVELKRGQLSHVGHGVVRMHATAPLEDRLLQLHQELTAAIVRFRPQVVAVEGLFTYRNARSALVLGHARGVALLAAAQGALPVHEYAPSQVKKAVGAGGADGKDAVARMVRLFLKLEILERADATDALAVAICHLNQARAALPKPSVRKSLKGKRLTPFEDRLVASYRRPEAR